MHRRMPIPNGQWVTLSGHGRNGGANFMNRTHGAYAAESLREMLTNEFEPRQRRIGPVVIEGGGRAEI